MAGTCLITGGTGYIGSQTTRHLVARGWTVHALVRSATASVNGAASHHYRGTYGDVLIAIEAARPTAVVHLAAHSTVSHRARDIAPLVEANVLFGTQILEAMAEVGCSHMVAAGTAWQHYGMDDDRYRAANLYAATKQAFDDIARWYADARGISVTSLHLGDTYGPNDPRPKLFSILTDAARTGAPLELTAGEQTLDPLFIGDAVRAIEVAALRTGHGFEAFNLAPGNPIRLRELVNQWCNISGARPDLRWGAKPYREREVMVSWAGGNRLPGWQAQISLSEGLLRCMNTFGPTHEVQASTATTPDDG